MLLTSSHEKAPSHWEKIMSIARDELAMGSFLLDEAKSLAGEKLVLAALGTMVAGLVEYVRVVRSITSTLCDLLGVGVTAEVQELKDRIELLDSALEVEDLWNNVRQAASQGLDLDVPPLESIVEIRSKCLQRFAESEHVCQLTLQPLSEDDKETTTSPVDWEGRFFMACAANFWANRVSTSAPV